MFGSATLNGTVTSATASNVASTTTTLSVIDPCNRTGKINIPMTYVTETKGVADFLRYAQIPPPDAKDLSLCLLFHKGRCNAGTRCNQVHAAVDYVDLLRTRAAAVKSCCAGHGDVHSAGLDGSLTAAVSFDNNETTFYRMLDFAKTAALDNNLRRARDGLVRVQGNRICRLHQRGTCKFGRDCKNIHLCPQATPIAHPPAAVAPAVMAAAVSAQQQPSAHPLPKYVAVSAAAPHHHTFAAPTTPPPSMGYAFRAMDISNRCCDTSVSSVASERSVSKAASEDGYEFASLVKPLCTSVLSSFSEFNSIRAVAADPLDIVESDVSTTDFDAFVDALVDCGSEPLSSPQWIVA